MSFVEAAIRRMSPLSRGDLQRRLIERAIRTDHSARLFEASFGLTLKRRVRNAYAMLGRFSALTSGLEAR